MAIMSSIGKVDLSGGQYLDSSESLIKYVNDTEAKRTGSVDQVTDTE